jgi:hypothetical protein
MKNRQRKTPITPTSATMFLLMFIWLKKRPNWMGRLTRRKVAIMKSPGLILTGFLPGAMHLLSALIQAL